MPPGAGNTTAPPGTASNKASGGEEDNWVNVSWMPHASLSQTSHVCLLIRSSHVSLDELSEFSKNLHEQEEWKVFVSIRGFGGIVLVPISLQTPTSSLMSRATRQLQQSSAVANNSAHVVQQQYPSILKATHVCQWDHFLPIPIRWRDLPRDSYLHFEIIDHTGIVKYETSMPFFNNYGKLKTGLMRLELHPASSSSTALPSSHGSNNDEDNILDDTTISLNSRNNAAIATPNRCTEAVDAPPMWQEEDPVWKASAILDQLQKFQDSRDSSGIAANGGASINAITDTRKTTLGSIPSVPWLDSISKGCCLKLIQDASKRDKFADYTTIETSPAYLIIELPVFEIPVMHEETFYPLPQHMPCASGPVSPLDLSIYKKKVQYHNKLLREQQGEGEILQPYYYDGNLFSHPFHLVKCIDYENEMDNPVEDKYRKLAHDLLRGLVDPALKPDREQRDRLAAIINSPSHHPTREEKDLLWRFRFSLVDNHRALTKFLLAVDWTVESEVVQAAELLEQWRRRSPIEVTDALKLLGKHVAFQTNLVRTYAIDTLAAAPDTELRLYLLQLVQALKYETNMQTAKGTDPKATSTWSVYDDNNNTSPVSSLAAFLVGRAAGNIQLASYLYWYLKVELDNPTHGERYKEVFAALKARLSETTFRPTGVNTKTESQTGSLDNNNNKTDSVSVAASSLKSMVKGSVSKLSSSLRGSDNQQSQHHQHPSGNSAIAGSDIKSSSSNSDSRHKSFWDILVIQDHFISGLMDIQTRCRDTRGRKDVKEAEFRSLLSKEGYDRNSCRDAVPLPSAPHFLVNGVNPETAKMFKSALYPALVEFHVELELGKIEGSNSSNSRTTSRSRSEKSDSEGSDHLSHYKVIVKTGDDLRQDQLVIMMIQLMDGLLKRAALDLRLSPYSIIAMSATSGLVEFVDGSIPISQILSNYNGSILQFFQSCAPQQGAKYNVRPDVISTYVRSCAGYCVITYLLAVGDRHLDNILMDTDGHFFHIDFGYIFGRDPKPLPPAFRLTREMVEGMGGLESIEYRQFCSLACQAFNALRKSAGLVLNLLHLMSDAGIEDLSNNPSADADGVIAKVEERFRLELTDEQAERYFLGLINDCLSALAPRVFDAFHALAVARR